MPDAHEILMHIDVYQDEGGEPLLTIQVVGYPTVEMAEAFARSLPEQYGEVLAKPCVDRVVLASEGEGDTEVSYGALIVFGPYADVDAGRADGEKLNQAMAKAMSIGGVEHVRDRTIFKDGEWVQ